jgi:type II secretory pathway pseudopilin PulG
MARILHNAFMGKKMKDKKGVTVVELLIGIGILSIMMIMILGFSREQVGRAALKGSANELIGEINTVRGRAARENRPVALTFTSNSYKEHVFENGAWDPALTDNSIPDGTVPETTSIMGSSTIVFNSRGIIIDPNTFLIKGNIMITMNSVKYVGDSAIVQEGIKIKVYSYGGIKTKNTWRDYNEYSSF